MSETNLVPDPTPTPTKGKNILGKVLSFLKTKQGIALLAIVILIAAFSFMRFKKINPMNFFKKSKKDESSVVLQQQVSQQPGFVSVPVDTYQKMQEEINNNYQPESDSDEVNSLEDEVPLNTTKTADEIQQQDLTQNEMESIQEQLNNIQRQRASINNANA